MVTKAKTYSRRGGAKNLLFNGMQDNVSERITDEKKNLDDLSESLVQIGFRSQNVAIGI